MSDLPAIEFPVVRAVRKDANHNAFTDLCLYEGSFYLAFRSSPDGHRVSSSSRIVVLQSRDWWKWSEAFSFSVPGRDTRDPHFLIFRGSLFVYTGTWLVHGEGVPLNLNEHLGYAAWTADGSEWNGPAPMEGTYGHYIWRAATHGGRAYLCGRRRRGHGSGIADEQQPGSIESAMLASDDGLVWSFHSLFVGDSGDETAFLFEEDGSALALVRDGAGKRARVCRSAPPWKHGPRHTSGATSAAPCWRNGATAFSWEDARAWGTPRRPASGGCTGTPCTKPRYCRAPATVPIPGSLP